MSVPTSPKAILNGISALISAIAPPSYTVDLTASGTVRRLRFAGETTKEPFPAISLFIESTTDSLSAEGADHSSFSMETVIGGMVAVKNQGSDEATEDLVLDVLHDIRKALHTDRGSSFGALDLTMTDDGCMAGYEMDNMSIGTGAFVITVKWTMFPAG